jgi:hypothetical protein
MPSPPLTSTSTDGRSAAPETPVAATLRAETLVADSWRDSLGTVRVHIVVSATNDTSESRSLANGGSFRLIGADGQVLHSGRFTYAFPPVVAPGDASYLITTVVLPIGVDGAGVRVEPEIAANVSTGDHRLLEVSDLELVSTDGRPGVRGLVRNGGSPVPGLAVVGVIGRDAGGRVVGGWYDNVIVASITGDGEAPFQMEYPGVPSSVAGRIANLSGIAFDLETSTRS